MSPAYKKPRPEPRPARDRLSRAEDPPLPRGHCPWCERDFRQPYLNYIWSECRECRVKRGLPVRLEDLKR